MVKGYIARKKAILNSLYFYYSAHNHLWNWLYEDITRDKFDWPEWKNKKYKNAKWSNGCFGCFYKDHIFKIRNINSCYKYCPFKIDKNVDCLNGLYSKYCDYRRKYKNITNYYINSIDSQENYINILSQEKYYQLIKLEKELKNIILKIRDFPIKKKINNRKVKLI